MCVDESYGKDDAEGKPSSQTSQSQFLTYKKAAEGISKRNNSWKDSRKRKTVDFRLK